MNLTNRQIESLRHGEPVYIQNEDVGAELVLLRRDLFEETFEFHDWDPRLMRRHIVEMMHEDWGDPAMSVYDQLTDN